GAAHECNARDQEATTPETEVSQRCHPLHGGRNPVATNASRYLLEVRLARVTSPASDSCKRSMRHDEPDKADHDVGDEEDTGYASEQRGSDKSSALLASRARGEKCGTDDGEE